MPSLVIENTKAKDPEASAALVTIHDFSATIPKEAELIKSAALKRAAEVVKIDDDAQLAIAVTALRGVKDIIKEVGLTRLALAAPFAAIGKDLIQKEKSFLSNLEKERDRLLGIANNYEQRKLRAAQEEQQRLAAEQAKKNREAQAAIDAANKMADDARKLAERAKSAPLAQKAALDAAALQAAMDAEDAAMDAAPAVAPVAIVVAPVKVAGFAAKEVIDFEVMEPHVFAQAYPEFWKPSDENKTLKVDVLFLREEINKPVPNKFQMTLFPEELPLSANSLPRPPGLRLFRKMQSRTS